MNLGRWWFAAVLAGCGVKPPGPEPSGVARLELTCPQHSVAAYDFTRSLLSGPSMSCTARVRDVAGAPIAGVQVHLVAEAGRLRGGTSNSEGVTELFHEVSLPTPLDVEPVSSLSAVPNDAVHTGEPVAPEWMRPGEWGAKMSPLFFNQQRGQEPRRPDPVRLKPDGTRFQNNPRDNLVTLVVWVDGSEPLDDTNGNGKHDPGETFGDLTEPFLDADDDGTRGPSEEFVDANGNGQWDGRNGVWDDETKVWAQERVLWTGLPSSQEVALILPGVVGQLPTFRSRAPPLLCPSQTGPCLSALALELNSFVPGVIHFYMADPWFNAMARTERTNGCVVIPGQGASLVRYGPVLSTLDNSLDAPDGLLGTVAVSDVRDPNSPQTNRPRSLEQPYGGLVVCEVSDGSPEGHWSVVMGFGATIQ